MIAATPLTLSPDVRIVLVGNGPAVLRGSLGAVIDAHEEIVRFNTFHLRGFETHTGARTTLWSTFGRGSLPFDADVRPSRMILCHENDQPAYEPSELHVIPAAFYATLKERLQAVTTYTGEQKEKLAPSSGVLVAAWLLEVVGVRCLHVTGFDHFRKEQSKQHHYWMPQAFGRPKQHDGDAEQAQFAAWQTAGRVEYLAA